MFAIEGTREEAALPDVSAGLVTGVPECGVASVGLLEREGERVGMVRNDDEVNVVRHQAVTEDREASEFCRLPQQREVDGAFCVGCEEELSGVAALGYMVRDADGNDTRQAGHVCETSKQCRCGRIPQRANSS